METELKPYKKAIELGITDKLFVASFDEIKPWNIMSLKIIPNSQIEIYVKRDLDASATCVQIGFEKSSGEGDYNRMFFVDYRCAETHQRELIADHLAKTQLELDEALKKHKEAIELQKKVLNQQRLDAM